MMRRSLPAFFAAFCLLIIFSTSCRTTQPLATFNPEERSSALDSWQFEGAYSNPSTTDKKNYQASYTKDMQLMHTRLELSFDWEKQYVEGLAILTLKPFFYPQSQLTLDAKNFDIHQIRLLDDVNSKSLTYTYDGEKLKIELGKTFTKAEQLKIEIEYTAKPAEREASGSKSISSDRGLYFINPTGNIPNKPRQIWTQGETEANSCWFPTIDAPNQRSTQEMFITIENNFKTLSNGELIYSKINPDNTRTDYWKMDQPHAPYLFMLAVGEYEVVEDQWDNIPLYYYVEPAYKDHAKAIFGKTPQMMAFFSEILGVKYPWNKYAQVVVRDFVSGAMENTTASVFMENVQVDANEIIDQDWENIIAHELFHHWFGDLVTCESWSNLPLNEAFANYAEYLWLEHSRGFEAAQEHAYSEREDYLEEAEDDGRKHLIRFFYEDREDMFDSHSYAKGGLVLHMLRREVGDEAFFASLKWYLEKHAYQSVEIHDLRLAFEKITGKDLNWFFNQWFLSAGHPDLEVQHTFYNDTLAINIQQTQMAPSLFTYRLPLKVEIWQNGKPVYHTLVLDERKQSFFIPVKSKPDAVVIDPEGILVGEIIHEKSYEEFYYQFQNSPYYSSKIEALVGMVSTLDQESMDEVPIEIALELLEQSFDGLRELGIELIEGFDGPELPLIEKKLVKVAKEDKKSVLRADAISSLAEISVSRHEDLFLAALSDSSYAVRGAAIYALSLSERNDILEILRKHEHLPSSSIQIPIADYYVRSKVENKYPYFEKWVQKFGGQDLWYLMQYTAFYLLSVPNDGLSERALDMLFLQCASHTQDYIRKTMYDILGLFPDLPQSSVMKAKMRDNESDPDLLEYFEENL